MESLSFLVDAKREYMYQLCKVMCPAMMDTYRNMFRDVQSTHKRKVYLHFQERLRDINTWNQHTIYANTQDLIQRCSWFPELVSAVFVSFIKILSSIRLTNTTKQPTFMMPSTEVFVHACFVAGAKELYKTPFWFRDTPAAKVDDALFELCGDAIENTVKDMIPVQQILAVYMQKRENDDDENDQPEAVGSTGYELGNDEVSSDADGRQASDEEKKEEEGGEEENCSENGEGGAAGERVPFAPLDPSNDPSIAKNITVTSSSSSSSSSS